MTITSNHVAAPVEESEVDRRPGSSDVEWAERAYHQRQREPVNQRRTWPRMRKHGLSRVIATFAVVLGLAGLVVAMRYEGSSSSPVVQQPAPSQPVTATPGASAPSPFTAKPPLLGPFSSLFPTLDPPTR